MSTKMTIAHGKGYHLYAECLESTHVYLQIDGGKWMESYGSEFYREHRAKEGKVIDTLPEMVLRIPAEIAERLFESDLPVWGEGGMPLKDVATVDRATRPADIIDYTKSTPLGDEIWGQDPVTGGDIVDPEYLRKLQSDIRCLARTIKRIRPHPTIATPLIFDQALLPFTINELTK